MGQPNPRQHCLPLSVACRAEAFQRINYFEMIRNINNA
uniref:Uncharacterized protein n=1 Tax=Anguilla anguilla TaxID=7936 RepID=A0A0E9QD99_ANGAN